MRSFVLLGLLCRKNDQQHILIVFLDNWLFSWHENIIHVLQVRLVYAGQNI